MPNCVDCLLTIGPMRFWASGFVARRCRDRGPTRPLTVRPSTSPLAWLFLQQIVWFSTRDGEFFGILLLFFIFSYQWAWTVGMVFFFGNITFLLKEIHATTSRYQPAKSLQSNRSSFETKDYQRNLPATAANPHSIGHIWLLLSANGTVFSSNRGKPPKNVF